MKKRGNFIKSTKDLKENQLKGFYIRKILTDRDKEKNRDIASILGIEKIFYIWEKERQDSIKNDFEVIY